MRQCTRTMAGAPLCLAGVLLGLLLLFPAVVAAERGCRAIEGDTLQCGRERIRIEGVDTPEKGQPGYEAAKDRLRQLTEGKNLRIERRARDKYGRTVAKVTVNGEDVGKWMKREGHLKPKKRGGEGRGGVVNRPQRSPFQKPEWPTSRLSDLGRVHTGGGGKGENSP